MSLFAWSEPPKIQFPISYSPAPGRGKNIQRTHRWLMFNPSEFPSMTTTTALPALQRTPNRARGRDYILPACVARSEEQTSELQSLIRHPYADLCLNTKKS